MSLLETIRNLEDKVRLARCQAQTFEKAITALRDTCDHKWADNGHDPRSGADYYICTQCAAEKKE